MTKIQQIPAGYKQTDVGIIPEDWEVKKFEQLLKVRHGRGQKEIEQPDGKYPILATGGEIGRTNTSIYDKPSVLIGRKGTIDKPQIMFTPFWTVDTLFYTELKRNVDPKFLFYKCKMIDWYQFNEASGVPSLNAKTIELIAISTPTSLDEQKDISKTISDIDSLISKLDQLIQKKKNIKQGAMQELLTGKRRLPGFSGEWEEKKLGELIDLKNGYSFKSDNYLDGGAYSIVTIANVQHGHMDASHFNKIARLPNDIQAHQKLSINDLLISMTGNVGRVCRVTLSNCLLNQRVGKIVSKGLNELYLFYLLNRSCFLEEMILKAQGGAQGNIGKNDILSYSTKITVNIDEQIAISRVLSDFDREIDGLTKKRDKFQDLKQGMMQQLLTGKIRLI